MSLMKVYNIKPDNNFKILMLYTLKTRYKSVKLTLI
jgi:hypothetical protein